MSAARSSPTLPFKRQNNSRHGVRVVVTGQVGLDKKQFLEQVVSLGRKHGREIHLFNVGEMMCREAPDVVPQRILDLSRHRLTSLRRSVFKDILQASTTGIDMIVSTHATFRWKHGLFHAYDDNQMRELDANLYVTLVDNVDAVHERLLRDHEIRHSLKDILVWREEEIVVTEAMAEGIAGYGHAYVLSRGDPEINVRALYRLMFEPNRKRVYPSFPMTHIMNLPDTLREIEAFRDVLAEHFITFDPADLDEKRLLAEATEATRRGDEFVALNVNGNDVRLSVDEINRIGHDIDAQIYARDFKLIDQSDIIVSYIPELPGGRPGLSSGVERELQHAFEGTKEVYVIWRSREEPSPFITETATGIFASVQELFQFFQEKGYVAAFQLGL